MRVRYPLALFDADHTLLDFDQTEEYSLLEALKDQGIRATPSVVLPIYRSISRSLWAAYENKEIGKAELRTERFKRLCSTMNFDIDSNQLAEIYLDHIAESSILLEGAEDLCKELARHCDIMIVTNGFAKQQHSRIKKSPIKPYITKIIVSEECGFPKPDPRIFEHALSAAPHFRKADAIMVGDRIATDIMGAKNANIDSCWYNPNGNTAPDHARPTYEAKNLRSIEKIVIYGN